MYSLKLYDETLIQFDIENKLTLKISNINVISDNQKLFPEILQKEVTGETIKEFLEQRIVPKNRTYAKNILESNDLDLRDIKGVIDISKGLSLIDCYWIVQDESLKFSDYNLYEHNFSTVLSLVAFTGYSSKIKRYCDFTRIYNKWSFA